jgi:hypothetical protein
MKRRILNHGAPATHGLIAKLQDFNDPASISDYDGFIVDLKIFTGIGIPATTFTRRQTELRELVFLKGGIVICVLRQSEAVNIVNGQPGTHSYALLTRISEAVGLVQRTARSGEGSRLKVIADAKGALGGYFHVLRGKLHFDAYLELETAKVEEAKGTVFAVNSPGLPVALEFVVGQGRICFIPLPDPVSEERLGSALARIIDAHFGEVSVTESPAWASEVAIPGAQAFDSKISELEAKHIQLTNEISDLTDKRTHIVSFRALLFESGRALEKAVREGMRQVGFEVTEPETYAGEWDVQLCDPASAKTAIAEVEGSEGIIDIDKYRQLLNYVQAEALDDRDHKGILIGNGYRLQLLNAPERELQFSEHVLKGAAKFGSCLLPTTELFKAVCAVLENPDNDELKTSIRQSLLGTVGVWNFGQIVVRPKPNPHESPTANV